MIIKILGSGCRKCVALAEIAAYGVMSTPGLVVDGKLLSSGKVLSAEDIGKLI